jgi:hypothetical protein
MLSAKILSVGYDRELMRLRELLIRQSLGVEVCAAFDLASALEKAQNEDELDAVLLCYTVPVAHQGVIVEAARARHGNIPALGIYPAMCAEKSAENQVSNDPEELLRALNEALDCGKRALRAAS